MNWKIVGIAISIIIVLFIIVYGFATQSAQTPPPYVFSWKLSIVGENDTTIILEIENITIKALNTESSEFCVDITNESPIPLYSVIDVSSGEPVRYPFNSSYVIYEDRDYDGFVSIGDRVIINKTTVKMGNYLNYSLIIITGNPWKKLSFRFGIFGVDVAIAKVPPPYVKVTPAVLNEIYDYEDHVWKEHKYWLEEIRLRGG